jgi:DUF4097 and DUF4098 domain-containing protein YvlB
MPIFDTPEPITAVIEITAGRVQINAGDRADTVVDVRPRDKNREADVHAAEQTQVEYAGGQLSVRAPKNKLRSLLGRPPSIEVTIELPSDSRVDAKGWADYRSEGRIGESSFDTAAGSIRLDQTGGLKLRTAAGNVSVGRSNGHTDVSTSSGKIWIGEIDGAAVVKTANGDITVGEVTDDVRLNTANGDITVHRALAAVSAKTAYGSVRIGEVVRGTVVLETSFGELELGVREGTAAWLDVSSQHGSVRSDLEASDGPEASADTVEVRARTGYGDIVIRRP